VMLSTSIILFNFSIIKFLEILYLARFYFKFIIYIKNFILNNCFISFQEIIPVLIISQIFKIIELISLVIRICREI